MINEIYPAIGILARLSLKIQQQLNPDNFDELTIADLIYMVDKLPEYAIYELWKHFHEGNYLDDIREQWLMDMLHKYGYAHLEMQSKYLYNTVKQLLEDKR